MFWAKTCTREPRVESTIASSARNDGQIATSTPSAVETRGSRACDERLGLGHGLVHLPVAGDERSPRAHASASTPGSGLPSISSSAAPPPVERWVTLSASPNWVSAAAESPPPTTVVPGRRGHRLGHGAGAGGERLELERAHRAVPEHGPGAGRSAPA